MKYFILFVVIILLFSPMSNAISIPLGEAAPEFNLKTMEGQPVSLSSYKGQLVVLIYWRADHNRSIEALSDAKEVISQLKNKKIQTIGIIAGGEDLATVKEIMKNNGIDFPVLIDSDRKLYSDYGIRVYPTTLIINDAGALIKDIPSHPLSYKHMLKGYIRQALGEIDEAGLNEILSPHVEKKDDAELEALRLYNLALKFTTEGMLEIAGNTVQKSIEAKSDIAKSHVLKGFLALEAKDADKAFEAFNKAVELDAHSKEAQTGLGGALVLKGEPDKAIEILESAAKANPYPQMTYYELGKAYESKGDKDKTIEMFKKAIEKIIDKNVLPSSLAKCR